MMSAARGGEKVTVLTPTPRQVSFPHAPTPAKLSDDMKKQRRTITADVAATQNGRHGERIMDFQPMSPDEMQRTMQFLIDHHAKFAVDLDKLEEKTQRIADSMIVVTSVLGQLITEQRATNQRVDRLHVRLLATPPARPRLHRRLIQACP